MNSKTNPDLLTERRKAVFNVEELTHILDGGEKNTKQRRYYENAILKYSHFKDQKDLFSVSPENCYETALKFVLGLRKCAAKDPIIKEMMETNEIFPWTPNSLFEYPQMQRIISPLDTAITLHSLMFTSTIESQGTEEQQKKWLPLAREFKIIGTYCQTELGHGTNMRGLETTAIYDPKTEEFVLNSPTLTSTKFWAGGLSYTCNFAIVVCQLYTESRCRGLHLFIVQIRNLKDHTPLQGITLGPVGPKMGFHSMDNGFLHLENVRIPRENMLMKYAQVLRDGTYIKPPRQRFVHGVFFHSRLFVAASSGLNIAVGTTIAIRFAAVRRQGAIIPGEPEIQILDYRTIQNKLFPHIACAYAILLSGRSFLSLIMNVMRNPTEEKISELHAISSGMKSLCTKASFDALEQCRSACGGLGYLQASNLPNLLCKSIAACTYEGDNVAMSLQTARYLVKMYRLAKQGADIPSSVAFLVYPKSFVSKQTHLKNLLTIFQMATYRSLAEVTQKMDIEISEGLNPEFVWQNHTNTLVKCSNLYCQFFLLDYFVQLPSQTEISSSVQTVLLNLYELLAIYWIQQNAAVIVEFSDVDSEFLKILNIRWEKLLELLRPNAVALVDAFDFRDQALHSILGCYDGNVYDRVFDYVKTLPMTGKVHPSFKKLLQPHLISKI